MFEEDRDRREEDKERGVRKRFSSFGSAANYASKLYEILSKSDVHGGSPINVMLSQIEPTDCSCGFLHRPVRVDDVRLRTLRYGVELLCIQIAQMVGEHGGKDDNRPSKVNQGGAFLLSLVDGLKGGSEVMQSQGAQVLVDIREIEWDFENETGN